MSRLQTVGLNRQYGFYPLSHHFNLLFELTLVGVTAVCQLLDIPTGLSLIRKAHDLAFLINDEEGAGGNALPAAVEVGQPSIGRERDHSFAVGHDIDAELP